MVWVISYFKQLWLDFKFVLFKLITDIKNVFFDLKLIFKKPIYLPVFIFILILVYFSLFIIYIVTIFYFILFLFRFFKDIYFCKKTIFNESNPFVCKFEINDNIYENTILLHIYYYYIVYPKLKGYQLMYIFLNFFFKKKSHSINIVLMILIFILIIPIRFFIKILTGFSYFSIKIASSLVVSFIDVLSYKFDSWRAVLDNVLLDFNSEYIYLIINEISNYRIYEKNLDIIFNPLWYDFFFKDIKAVEKAIISANNVFKLRKIETKYMTPHPGFVTELDKNNPHIKTFIQQSSSNERPMSGGLADKALLNVPTGAFNKPGTHNFAPVSINTQLEQFKIQNVSTWKNMEFFNLQKKTAFQTLFLGLYKKDLIIVNGEIIQNPKFNFFIDRLIEAYDNKTLDKESYESISYLLEFVENNGITNDYLKILAWETLFKGVVITTDNKIFFPNFKKEELPLALKNTIDNFE